MKFIFFFFFSGQFDDFLKRYKLLISLKAIHKSNQNLGSSVAFSRVLVWLVCVHVVIMVAALSTLCLTHFVTRDQSQNF